MSRELPHSSGACDHAQAQCGSGNPDFPDCELCAASTTDYGGDEAGAAEAARHLLVNGLLRQYYVAQGKCPAGVARELFRLLSSSADQQVKAVFALQLIQLAQRCNPRPGVTGGDSGGFLMTRCRAARPVHVDCVWLPAACCCGVLMWLLTTCCALLTLPDVLNRWQRLL